MSNVLVTLMRGHITRAIAERQFEQFRLLVASTHESRWIIEQIELTGFDPGAVTAGARWFSAFKQHGGQQVIFVSPLAAARMVAASLAFAVHAKVSSCDTLKEAYERAGIAAESIPPRLLSIKPPRIG